MADMVQTTLNGVYSLTLPRHRAERSEWHTERGLERRRIDAMTHTIHPGDLVVDVGAEEGDMSALCAQAAGVEGGMILVEPSPRVWPNIRAIWEHNTDLAPVLDWFVGFASAEKNLTPPNDNVTEVSQPVIVFDRGTDGVVREGRWWPTCAYGEVISDHGFRHLAQEADATPQQRLDDIVAPLDASVDVITMDVEGAEFEVLKGAYDILAVDKPAVFVSIHPPSLWDLYKTTPEEIHNWMASLGYFSNYLTSDHEEHWAFTHSQGRQLWTRP